MLFLTILIVFITAYTGHVSAQNNRSDLRGSISLVPVVTSHAKLDNTDSLRGLSEAVSKWTQIDSHLSQRITLDSQRLKNYPFIYINTDRGFDLLESEKKNFVDYLTSGGFALVEFDVRSYQALKNFLPQNARLRPIDDSHPIYSSCFNLDNSIWMGGVHKNLGKMSAQSIIGSQLTGIWIGEKLVGIYSDKNLGNEWGEYWRNKEEDNSFLRFGVNVVAYVLANS